MPLTNPEMAVPKSFMLSPNWIQVVEAATGGTGGAGGTGGGVMAADGTGGGDGTGGTGTSDHFGGAGAEGGTGGLGNVSVTEEREVVCFSLRRISTATRFGAGMVYLILRSEERRGGEEWVSPCESRGAAYP